LKGDMAHCMAHKRSENKKVSPSHRVEQNRRRIGWSFVWKEKSSAVGNTLPCMCVEHIYIVNRALLCVRSVLTYVDVIVLTSMSLSRYLLGAPPRALLTRLSCH